jgi:hypothetical protein
MNDIEKGMQFFSILEKLKHKHPGRTLNSVLGSQLSQAEFFDALSPYVHDPQNQLEDVRETPQLTGLGLLPPRNFLVSRAVFFSEFGCTIERKQLLNLLETNLAFMRELEIAQITVGGSFVTAKKTPADIDFFWTPNSNDARFYSSKQFIAWFALGLDGAPDEVLRGSDRGHRTKLLSQRPVRYSDNQVSKEISSKYKQLPHYLAVGTVTFAI